MSECPVNMVDYESSLIAADWYEEQGEGLIADQIRHTPDVVRLSFIYYNVHPAFMSHCRSRRTGRVYSQASCNEVAFMNSICTSRCRLAQDSKCGSGRSGRTLRHRSTTTPHPNPW